MTVRIPRRFYEDHVDRDLPAPPIVRATVRHYFIDATHPDAAELLSDARFYASEYPYMDAYYVGLGRSAQATADALARHIPRTR